MIEPITRQTETKSKQQRQMSRYGQRLTPDARNGRKRGKPQETEGLPASIARHAALAPTAPKRNAPKREITQEAPENAGEARKNHERDQRPQDRWEPREDLDHSQNEDRGERKKRRSR